MLHSCFLNVMTSHAYCTMRSFLCLIQLIRMLLSQTRKKKKFAFESRGHPDPCALASTSRCMMWPRFILHVQHCRRYFPLISFLEFPLEPGLDERKLKASRSDDD